MTNCMLIGMAWDALGREMDSDEEERFIERVERSPIRAIVEQIVWAMEEED